MFGTSNEVKTFNIPVVSYTLRSVREILIHRSKTFSNYFLSGEIARFVMCLPFLLHVVQYRKLPYVESHCFLAVCLFLGITSITFMYLEA